MLILPIQEHGRSFHSLVSSSISFFKNLKFLSYWSSICLVRVTPRYLCYLWLWWWVMFLWFLSQPIFHLFKRRLIDSFELILYPATLVKVFMSCSSFVEFLVSFMQTIILSANRESLTSSFLIHIPLISFCCLIVLARTTSTHTE